MSLSWGRVPGDPNNLWAKTKRHIYQTHIGHGRLWYGFQKTLSGKALKTSQAQDGPEAARRVREWCEAEAAKEKP